MMGYRSRKAVAKLVGILWHRHRFLAFGRGSFILNPIGIVGEKYIAIGSNVRIRDHLRIEALDAKRKPTLSIGNNTNIEQNVHIICSSQLQIGKDCSITANCCITDTSHPFDGPDGTKIGDRLNDEPAEVIIGDGCFIGVAASILPNARLGKRCIVGSHAVVVAGYYPDGSVLVGSPARILRRTGA